MRSKNSIEKWEDVMNNEVWELDAFLKDISPALWLSYHNLPYAIKRCFSFCTIFPKDYNFDRDELIRLWMTHNYLGCGDGSKEMEMVGRDYFEYLAAVSFFQDFKKDLNGNIVQCKMHDIVHDSAQFFTKSRYIIVESDWQRQRGVEKIWHATLIVEKYVETIVFSPSMKNLHTLFLFYHCYPKSISPSFLNFTFLRALKLDGRGLDNLPEEVGKLIHLRYLDLSSCWGLVKLTETIFNLYNLQTLDISGCINLHKLPQVIGKLSNLRHLIISTALEYLPKGISKLSCLQTLDKFIVCSSPDDECKISDLRNLIKLRGLGIIGLNDVRYVREAKAAQLEKMIHLQSLTLDFGSMTHNPNPLSDSYVSTTINKVVADALEPPPNLETLEIHSYGDVELPSWVVKSSLTHLKSILLWRLRNCSCLPPLGELPVLKSLSVMSMNKVKYVGDEFPGTSSTIAFPRLKNLEFVDMFSWKKWEVKEEEERPVMPSLFLENVQVPRARRATKPPAPDNSIADIEDSTLSRSEAMV